jgi:hypothetical protein
MVLYLADLEQSAWCQLPRIISFFFLSSSPSLLLPSQNPALFLHTILGHAHDDHHPKYAG